MASKSLSFLLFGEDVSASKSFRKLGAEAEASGTKVKGAFSSGSMLGVGALVAGLGLATKGAADFQTEMTRLVTAAGESQANLKMVSAGVMSISSATGTSLKGAADAMYYVESAGFHGQRGLGVLKAALQGAKIEGADTSVVADALTTALTDLGKKAGPPAVVMSQLVDTVSRGKTTLQDLAGSMHSVLPNAAALGIAFPQVAGALATMTAQGISADQAAQNLNFTIQRLAGPTAVQTKAMAEFGLNSTSVAKNIGKAGLTGTLQELSDAILHRMGPAGLTLTSALNTSQIAADKVTKGYKALTPAAQQYYNQLVAGKKASDINVDGTAKLTLAQETQVKQLVVLYKQAHGFSALLKAGSPDAMTYSAALAKMTGGMTGLQVATHLTGDNMTTFKANVADIGKATSDSSGNVKDFEIKQETLNQKLAELKVTASNLSVEFGSHLIPAVSSAASWALKHEKAVEYTVGGLVGLKVALVGVRLAQETTTAVMGVATAAQALYGKVSGQTAAKVEAAAVEEAAAVKTSSGVQVSANEAAGASSVATGGSARIGAIGLLGIAAAFGSAAYAAGRYADRNNSLASTIDGSNGAITDLTTALVNNGGKLDDNVRSILHAQLAHSGLIDKAARSKITEQQLTAAVTGNADALGALIAQWKASGKPSSDTITALMLQYNAYHRARDGVTAFASSLSSVPKHIVTTIQLAGIGEAYSNIRAIMDYANRQTAVMHVAVQMPSGQSLHGQVAYASGTNYSLAGTALVGEQGPERVILPRGSQVLSASRTRAADAQGAGANITIHNHISHPLGTPHAIGQACAEGLAAYTRSGGQLRFAGHAPLTGR